MKVVGPTYFEMQLEFEKVQNKPIMLESHCRTNQNHHLILLKRQVNMKTEKYAPRWVTK